VAAPAGFLIEVASAALGSVATDGEEDVDLVFDEEVDGGLGVDRAARGFEFGAAFLVDVLDEVVGEFGGRLAARGSSPR
jgi:hypothetical protein